MGSRKAQTKGSRESVKLKIWDQLHVIYRWPPENHCGFAPSSLSPRNCELEGAPCPQCILRWILAATSHFREVGRSQTKICGSLGHELELVTDAFTHSQSQLASVPWSTSSFPWISPDVSSPTRCNSNPTHQLSGPSPTPTSPLLEMVEAFASSALWSSGEASPAHPGLLSDSGSWEFLPQCGGMFQYSPTGL